MRVVVVGGALHCYEGFGGGAFGWGGFLVDVYRWEVSVVAKMFGREAGRQWVDSQGRDSWTVVMEGMVCVGRVVRGLC